MKKYIIGAAIAIVLAVPFYSHADDASQSLLNVWKRVSGYLTPTVSTNGVKIPSLSSTGSPCLTVNSTGVFATTTCGSGGGVSSVDMSVPAGLSISGNPITTSGTLALTLTAGYNIPLTASTTNWNNVYNNIFSRLSVATGTSGNIFNISTTTNAITFNLPTASASLTGQLSSTDWSTFNGKQQAITVATGTTGNIFNANLAAGTLTINCPVASATVQGCLSVTDWSTFNNKQQAITVATGTAGNIFNASLSGGTLTLNCPVASATVQGCVSSSDWSTFNNKQALFNIDSATPLNSVTRIRHSFNNFLSNSSFEYWQSGTAVAPTNWTLNGDATVSRNSSTSSIGSYSAQIVYGTANSGELYSDVSVSNQVDYTYSAYVQRTSGTGAARLVAQQEGGGFTEYASVGLPTIAGWQLVTLTVKPSTSGQMRFSFKSANTTASTWVVDEAMFQESLGVASAYLGSYLDDTTNGMNMYGNPNFINGITAGQSGTTLGTLKLYGNTSGVVTLSPAAAAGTWTLTFPTATGTSGQVLTTDGTGVTSWASSGVLSGGTIGFESRWTATNGLGVGKLMDNGTVLGMNATSSTIGFNIQGTAGTNDILNVASSSGTSILRLFANGAMSYATTTNNGTSTVLFAGQFSSNPVGSATTTISTAAFTVDWSGGNTRQFVLATSTTMTFANVKGATTYRIRLWQDGTGSRTVTWPSFIDWVTAPPTLSTSANKHDVISFICYTSNDCDGTATIGF